MAGALLAWSVLRQREQITEALHRLDAAVVAASLVFACLGLVAQMLSWRSLLAGTGTGGAPSLAVCARVYFQGQLGKYVPGSVWTVVAQAELGRTHRLSRARSAVVAVGALAVLLVVGGVVGVVGVAAASPASLTTYWWVGLLALLGAAFLIPSVFDRAVALALRLLRRRVEPVQVAGGALLRSAGWALTMWLLFGLHAAVLVQALAPGEPGRAVVLSAGAFALAWAVGLVVVIAPAGTGPREAALVLALAPALPGADALLVALVSRVLMVLADVGAAGAGALLVRRERAARATSPDGRDSASG